MESNAERFKRIPQRTPFLDLCYERRSVRRYTDRPVAAHEIDALLATVARFCAQQDFAAVSFVVVRDPQQRSDVLRGAMKGVVGKINPWLLRLQAPVLVALCATYDRAPCFADRNLAVAQAAQAMEVFVLAATARGLATCWMAGIHEHGLQQALAVPEGTGVVALTPLGYAPPKRALLSWDNAAFHLFSRRRKCLEEIVFEEKLS